MEPRSINQWLNLYFHVAANACCTRSTDSTETAYYYTVRTENRLKYTHYHFGKKRGIIKTKSGQRSSFFSLHWVADVVHLLPITITKDKSYPDFKKKDKKIIVPPVFLLIFCLHV